MLEKVLQAVDSQREESLANLFEFLRIPSVSAKPQHSQDMKRCAQWVADRLANAGLRPEIRRTAGHPIVTAKNLHDPGRPTVLFYGHYDVQPPEPLEQWISPPFEPAIRNNAVVARGAVDDKGQVWANIQAMTLWHRAAGDVPVNLTILIEGEEEVGSENLEEFVKSHREELKADIVLVCDTGQFARGIPAITYGLRGLVYTEVVLTGPDHDLHSGMFGGAVPNPANSLCELLATLHDREGRVAIPGFYDDVRPLSQAEREEWRSLPFDERSFLDEQGLSATTGETGYSTLERRWARPTCDINGLTSGYQGPGAKTIIPSRASAKVSMRLVPDQDPLRIVTAFENAMRNRCANNVKIELVRHGISGPVLVSREGRAMQLAAQAVETGFGAKPRLIREGGSIPVVGLFKTALGVDTLLVGFGLPDDRVHSPNEKFDLDALHCGTRTAAVLYETLATLKS